MFFKNLNLILALLFFLTSSLIAKNDNGSMTINASTNTSGPIEFTVRAAENSLTEGQTLEVPQGASIPIKISISGNMFEMEQPTKITIKAKKKFYLKLEQATLLCSYDQQDWLTWEDFANGTLNVSLKKSEEGLSANIDLEANFSE